MSKSVRFEAAHFLPEHDGKCRNVHGHSWVLHLVVEGPHLQEDGPKKGMLIDYGEVGAVCKELHALLDHSLLNEIPGLETPTSEVLALWVWERVKSRLPELACVVVEETCTSRCEFWPHL